MITLNCPIKPNLKKVFKYLETINTNGWYTNFGPLHHELTNRLENYLNVKNLLLVNNGTSALQVAGRALGTKSLLSTPFSFVATVSAFKWQNDQIAFSDINRNSYNLCPKEADKAFQKGCKADTILATHVYGNPCDVHPFETLAKHHKVKIIYDAAHAFGVNIGNHSVLNYGDASALSFHATKVFHTIEGGAIVFKNSEHYEIAKHIINFGIKPDTGIVNIGINAKLSEYHAAVGLANLDNIDNVIAHRAELFEYYRTNLNSIVEIPKWHPEANHNGAYMPIKLDSEKQLIKVCNKLLTQNIQSRHYFSPSLDRVLLNSYNYGTSNSNKVSEGILCLPMHANLTKADIQKVVTSLKKVL